MERELRTCEIRGKREKMREREREARAPQTHSHIKQNCETHNSKTIATTNNSAHCQNNHHNQQPTTNIDLKNPWQTKIIFTAVIDLDPQQSS